MNSLRLVFFLSALAMACAASAQTTFYPSNPSQSAELAGAASQLPLRNLQIEVRQIQQDDAARERIDAAGTVRLQPGQSGVSGGINAQGGERTRSSSAQQMALVLNGRRTTIMLGNSVPLRVFQSRMHNGVLRAVAGTLWLEAGTGFDAIARWNGGDMVDLELSAMQARGNLPTQTSSASTFVTVPLGEWVTVAQSDQELSNQQSGPGGYSRTSGQSQLRVQVRVSIR